MSDPVVVVFTVAVAALLLWRGIDAVSFLGALWIGASLIELYFHQFHRPVPPERAAPPESSPLKELLLDSSFLFIVVNSGCDGHVIAVQAAAR